MEFDFGWLLLGLPLAFALGWLASRLDWRQWRLEDTRAPKAYFKGLNYLLNEQQDAAIDAFIEAVRRDPDTTELHFALGNLFRRRGEYARAVRVHEHLLARADLTQTDRDRAQYALGLDFLKAGLIDRAEAALLALEGTDFESQARSALLGNCERGRDWPQAIALAQRMTDAGQADLSLRQAHYLCELAASLPDPQAQQARLAQALELAPQAPRPYLDMARWLDRAGEPAAAWTLLQRAWAACPQALNLLAQPLVDAALAAHTEDAARGLLEAGYARSHGLDVVLALVALDAPKAGGRWVQHLGHTPSLVAVVHYLRLHPLANAQVQANVLRALDHAAAPLLRYRCAACGFEAMTHFWQCPGCQSWDSYPPQRVEEA